MKHGRARRIAEQLVRSDGEAGVQFHHGGSSQSRREQRLSQHLRPQTSPRLMSSLRVGVPGAGGQVGVARISGQMASPATDSLYLSAMLPSGRWIVF